ncbi:MAG TPA: PDZ domain-containing protein, partial [Aggregatilineales bacterium]|nr:PDZ domain-containing protein [Aggregatilineales bacterium]
GPYQSGRLGISYRMLQPGDPFPVAEGALVIRTLDERAPAALAGLRPGDIIIEVDGVPVTSWNALEDTLAGFGAGERVRLVIIRAGEEMSLTAELG